MKAWETLHDVSCQTSKEGSPGEGLQEETTGARTLGRWTAAPGETFDDDWNGRNEDNIERLIKKKVI